MSRESYPRCVHHDFGVPWATCTCDPDPCPDCGGSGEVGWLTHPPDPQTAESRPCDCQRPGAPVTCDDDPLPF